jgi:hypothetical protein
VILRGWCEAPGAARIGFGECRGHGTARRDLNFKQKWPLALNAISTYSYYFESDFG